MAQPTHNDLMAPAVMAPRDVDGAHLPTESTRGDSAGVQLMREITSTGERQGMLLGRISNAFNNGVVAAGEWLTGRAKQAESVQAGTRKGFVSVGGLLQATCSQIYLGFADGSPFCPPAVLDACSQQHYNNDFLTLASGCSNAPKLLVWRGTEDDDEDGGGAGGDAGGDDDDGGGAGGGAGGDDDDDECQSDDDGSGDDGDDGDDDEDEDGGDGGGDNEDQRTLLTDGSRNAGTIFTMLSKQFSVDEKMQEEQTERNAATLQLTTTLVPTLAAARAALDTAKTTVTATEAELAAVTGPANNGNVAALYNRTLAQVDQERAQALETEKSAHAAADTRQEHERQEMQNQSAELRQIIQNPRTTPAMRAHLQAALDCLDLTWDELRAEIEAEKQQATTTREQLEDELDVNTRATQERQALRQRLAGEQAAVVAAQGPYDAAKYAHDVQAAQRDAAEAWVVVLRQFGYVVQRSIVPAAEPASKHFRWMKARAVDYMDAEWRGETLNPYQKSVISKFAHGRIRFVEAGADAAAARAAGVPINRTETRWANSYQRGNFNPFLWVPGETTSAYFAQNHARNRKRLRDTTSVFADTMAAIGEVRAAGIVRTLGPRGDVAEQRLHLFLHDNVADRALIQNALRDAWIANGRPDPFA